MEVMKIIPTLITLLFSTALTSRADVITQTIDFGSATNDSQFNVNLFNASLGTLTKIGLEWTVNPILSSAQFTNNGSSAVTINKIAFGGNTEFTIAGTGQGLYKYTTGEVVPLGGAGTLNPGQSYDVTNATLSSIYQNQLWVNPFQPGKLSHLFDTFTGSGTTPLLFSMPNAWVGAQVGDTYINSLALTGAPNFEYRGNLVVTYTYNAVAPVPEPPAVLLGFGGLLGMAGFALKRRATVALA
jgi:hypothetical protein